MVGLPYIGTVGACGGKMVAMVSPSAMPQKFHWGRVLKHEFVHVVNLQQTDFNIPHWFTEGLAVWHEKLPRPSMWLTILSARLKDDKLFDLATINHGFIRPASSTDWTLAYCQAELYVEYMSKTYGDDAPAKMLAAYRDNVETSAAIQQCFKVDVKEFEAGYRKHVEQLVAESGFQGDKESEPLKFAELIKKAEEEPQNAALQAQLAKAYLDREQHPQARTAALAAQKANAKEPLAAYVLARLQILIGDTAEAEKILAAAHDEKAPQEQVLALLAALRLKAEDYAAAAKLYELGAGRFKPADKWYKALAKVYLASKQEAELQPVLEKLVLFDGDDPALTKKLAQMTLAKKDYAAAARWARQTIYIDVLDAEAHALWAEAEARGGKFKAACAEYEVAVQLKGDRPDWRYAWGQAAADAGDKEQARKVLKELLEKTPDYAGADLLLESLDK
jgi:Flp pilus assembly protein TadD